MGYRRPGRMPPLLVVLVLVVMVLAQVATVAGVRMYNSSVFGLGGSWRTPGSWNASKGSDPLNGSYPGQLSTTDVVEISGLDPITLDADLAPNPVIITNLTMRSCSSLQLRAHLIVLNTVLIEACNGQGVFTDITAALGYPNLPRSEFNLSRWTVHTLIVVPDPLGGGGGAKGLVRIEDFGGFNGTLSTSPAADGPVHEPVLGARAVHVQCVSGLRSAIHSQ